MSERERFISVLVGLIGAVAFPLLMLADREAKPAPLMFAAGLALGVALVGWFFRSRIIVMLAAMGPLIAVTFSSRPTKTIDGKKVVQSSSMAPIILSYAFIGLMIFMKVRQSRDRRALMAARLATGKLDGFAESKKAKASDVATVDMSGRPVAAPSKRYTPPKKAKKR